MLQASHDDQIVAHYRHYHPAHRGFHTCLRRRSSRPTGDAWLHEIKHDGFRVVARKDGGRVRLYSRLATDASVFLYAFDLIELDGDDMRRGPFETRKAMPAFHNRHLRM